MRNINYHKSCLLRVVSNEIAIYSYSVFKKYATLAVFLTKYVGQIAAKISPDSTSFGEQEQPSGEKIIKRK
jgi:hypothetical protein